MVPLTKKKLRGMRGAPSTEDFQNQGIRILSDLLAVSPSRLGQMSVSVLLGDRRWILISHVCRLPTLLCHTAAPLGTGWCQYVQWLYSFCPGLRHPCHVK